MSVAVALQQVTKTFTLEHERARTFKEGFVRLVRGRRVERETFTALDDVSFALEHGETLAIVGPNGTGKSTVLKLLARILEPTRGTVMVDGRVAALLELGAGFHPDLSGRENVFLAGSMVGFSRREMERRLAPIVDFSELDRFIDTPVKHYSSGMYMRLGFATAIHLDADILLVDEVLSVGDQAFQSKCRDHIMALKKAGQTMVLVSHDQTAVRELCSRAIWIEDGRVVADGPTDAVAEAYYASMVVKEEARFAAEHDGQPVVAAAEDRWGSREVEITAVEFLGADGAAQHILTTGEAATIRFHYLAHERIEDPVFGLAIHRADGVHICGPNTLQAGLAIRHVDGPGTVDYVIERLPLLPATYEISAACYDASCSHPYDHHHRRYTVRVRAGQNRETLGLLSLPAQWRHAPAEPARGVPADLRSDAPRDPSAAALADPPVDASADSRHSAPAGLRRSADRAPVAD